MTDGNENIYVSTDLRGQAEWPKRLSGKRVANQEMRVVKPENKSSNASMDVFPTTTYYDEPVCVPQICWQN